MYKIIPIIKLLFLAFASRTSRDHLLTNQFLMDHGDTVEV